NGDGRPDLAAANATAHTVSVLLGNGDGTFQAARDSMVDDQPTAMAAGDLNGDGRPDLAVLTPLANHVAILLADRDGTLPPGTPLPLAAGNNAVLDSLDILLADLDGDGRLDLAVGARTYVAVFQGNGDGTFQPAQVIDSAFYPESLAAIDANG